MAMRTQICYLITKCFNRPALTQPVTGSLSAVGCT